MRLGRLLWSIKVALFMMSTALWAGDAKESLLEQARDLAQKGDLVKAAKAYQEVLTIDDKNEEARRGLALLVIQGQINEPYAEGYPEPLSSVLEEEEV